LAVDVVPSGWLRICKPGTNDLAKNRIVARNKRRRDYAANVIQAIISTVSFADAAENAPLSEIAASASVFLWASAS